MENSHASIAAPRVRARTGASFSPLNGLWAKPRRETNPPVAGVRGERAHNLLGFLTILTQLLFSNLAHAHDPGLSVATARLSEGMLCIDLALARSDADRLAALDADHDGRISEAEFRAARLRLEREALGAFAVDCAGRHLTPSEASVEKDDREGLHLMVAFRGITPGPLTLRSSIIARFPRGHRQFLTVREGITNVSSQQMLDANHSSVIFQWASSAAANPHSFREFLALGVEHIATGYDHLLFLLGLLLVGGSVRSALKIITSFTIAHSITLALATLNVVNISPRIIEPLIAASIVYVGLENIFRKGVENRWMLTFGFGLIHGCGFASALRDLGIGANGTSIIVPLLSFNLGVELGQLAIASVALPLIWKFRSSPLFLSRGVPIGSACVVIAGSYWLLQRTMF